MLFQRKKSSWYFLQKSSVQVKCSSRGRNTKATHYLINNFVQMFCFKNSTAAQNQISYSGVIFISLWFFTWLLHLEKPLLNCQIKCTAIRNCSRQTKSWACSPAPTELHYQHQQCCMNLRQKCNKSLFPTMVLLPGLLKGIPKGNTTFPLSQFCT